MKTDDKSKGWPEGWFIAAAAAVFSAVMARLVGDLGLFSALMIAIFVFLVFGVLLGMFWGGPVSAAHGNVAHGHAAHGSSAKDHAVAESAPVVAAVAPINPGIAETASARAIAVQDAAPVPATPSPPQAAPEAVATDDGMGQTPSAQALMAAPEPNVPPVAVPADPTPAPSSAPVDLMASGPVEGAGQSDGDTPGARGTTEERSADRAAKAVRQSAKSTKPKTSPETPVSADTVAAITSPEGGSKPQGLSGARGGVPDKLQIIEGIGPVLEKLCHELGIYHFDQIAGWGPAEIAWMDGNLKGFKGRVSRDKWVRQASLIGEVGVDEFLRRAKSNDY